MAIQYILIDNNYCANSTSKKKLPVAGVIDEPYSQLLSVVVVAVEACQSL